ncbi:hypothetical protein D3C81_2059470 [compost metagenome]
MEVVHAQCTTDIQGALAVVAAQADMGERLGRLGDRRRRAGRLVSQDGSGGKGETNGQHVLIHYDLICKFAKAESFLSKGIPITWT